MFLVSVFMFLFIYFPVLFHFHHFIHFIYIFFSFVSRLSCIYRFYCKNMPITIIFRIFLSQFVAACVVRFAFCISMSASVCFSFFASVFISCYQIVFRFRSSPKESVVSLRIIIRRRLRLKKATRGKERNKTDKKK